MTIEQEPVSVVVMVGSINGLELRFSGNEAGTVLLNRDSNVLWRVREGLQNALAETDHKLGIEQDVKEKLSA